MLPSRFVSFIPPDPMPPVLANKTILLISPQSWGNMFIAKHHYAISLAKRGNKVFFLNPPDNNMFSLANKRQRIQIEAQPNYPGVYLIWHTLYFPFLFKFHAKPVFDWLMHKQIKDILSCIGDKVDIVWSFDLENLYPLHNFATSLKIFHPVDEPRSQQALQAANGAQVLFSVTTEILEKYQHLPAKKYFINHGLTEEFVVASVDNNIGKGNVNLQVGLSGNWLRQDIDHACLLNIITENPAIRFNFWGSYKLRDTNIGGSNDEDTRNFIEALIKLPNVVMHGVVSSVQLAIAFKDIDLFLICYDVMKDQSKGTNYHKVMEYISTGKVTVSNNITTYQRYPELVQMVAERDNNDKLPALFHEVVTNISYYNSDELNQMRKDFARNNTYAQQINRIEEVLQTLN